MSNTIIFNIVMELIVSCCENDRISAQDTLLASRVMI